MCSSLFPLSREGIFFFRTQFCHHFSSFFGGFRVLLQFRKHFRLFGFYR
jgi:hypothetical protein